MIYKPHPGKQVEMLKATSDWVLAGGARGGTKSFSLAWKASFTPRRWHYEFPKGTEISKSDYDKFKKVGKNPISIVDTISIDYSDYIAILIRRTYPQLERNLKPECDKLYPVFDGKWQERNHCYIFPSGAKIYLVHCHDSRAKDNYIGGNYNFIGIDEANLFPWEWIEEIATSARTDNKELKPQIFLTANPGNIGHVDLKKRFVDRCTPIPDGGGKRYSKEFDLWYDPKKSAKPFIDEEGISWQFIPATVFDNPSLLKNDPGYVRRLKNLPPTLRKMWLEGDWGSFKGMFFDMWNYMHHVIDTGKNSVDYKYGEDFSLDTHSFYRFYDYGTKAPFVCLFATVDREGNMVIFDEIVETGLSASEQAKLVNKYTWDKYKLLPKDFSDEIAGHDYWRMGSEKEGAMYSTTMFYDDEGITLTRGIKDRKTASKVVYNAMTIPNEGVPKIRFTDNCEYCIETIPSLPSKEIDPEDVEDKNTKDHAFEALKLGASQIFPNFFIEENRNTGWRDKLKNQYGVGTSAYKGMFQYRGITARA